MDMVAEVEAAAVDMAEEEAVTAEVEVEAVTAEVEAATVAVVMATATVIVGRGGTNRRSGSRVMLRKTQPPN